MSTKFRISIALLFLAAFAQVVSAAIDAKINFENGVPSGFTCSDGGSVETSTLRFKDGEQSLRWSWTKPGQLRYEDYATLMRSARVKDAGVMVWVYNPKAINADMRIDFNSVTGEPVCHFDFHMDFTGWRAAWVKYSDMVGFSKQMKPLAEMVITTPEGMAEGELYIDRLTFSEFGLTRQITPDMQIPDNNGSNRGKFWHWARLWEWEQTSYDIPLGPVAPEQTAMVRRAEKQFNELLTSTMSSGQYITSTMLPKSLDRFNKAQIRRTDDGGVVGAPLLSDDEFNNVKGELRDAYIGDMLYAFALNNVLNGDKSHDDKFFLVFDHAIDQGFAFGSARGTNHHYGYQVRRLYEAMWFMRDQIVARGKLDAYIKVLTYWSGLAETRQPYEYGRDETLDSWNTLLQPKIISALMQPTDEERYRAMTALGRWVSGSLAPSPGTVGGIKVDGTTFHHGGFYPSYSVGAFTTLGQYCLVSEGTDFAPDQAARRSLKLALRTLRRYTNLLDWGLGVAGRHPFNTALPVGTANAFGALAALGDLTGSGKKVDPELAGDFLALKGNDKRLTSLFRSEGVSATAAPQGFFAYNYGAVGIHRRGDWMVTLKAYNSDVWGSEIYTKDNRYGRYQSYGTAPIIGSGNPVSAKASGFVQGGWDWNRAPGATTIHLPFEELESPYPGTLMQRGPVRFSGVSSLEGMNGVLAFHLIEPDRPRFTQGAEAYKSVFCFDNRMIFLGSGIENNNESYPTETTLYQLALDAQGESVEFDGNITTNFPLDVSKDNVSRLMLSDTKGNYYVVKDAPSVRLVKQRQESPNDKTKKPASGDFVTAYISHGVAPKQAGYEYAVYIRPSSKEVNKFYRKDAYDVLRRDNTAHVVYDQATGITGYVCFGDFEGDALVRSATGETILMQRKTAEGQVVMSVCTPDLGLTEKTYSTAQPSQPIVKQVILAGAWELATPSEQVQATSVDGATQLTVTCVDGLPVEFTLVAK